MAVLDFLFNGSPPPATTTYGSSTTTLPAWYNDYTQGLISKANQISSQPYQAFTGQRVAENSQLGSYDPATRQFSASPVLNQVQGLNSQFNQNFNPAIQTMQSMQARDQNGNLVNTALGQGGGQEYFTGAGGAGDIAKTGFTDARNLTQAGGGSSVGIDPTTGESRINNYMNPYTNNVVDEIGRLGQENLNNTLNNVGNKFISGGQFGSSRMGQSLGNATRAGLRDIAGQQGKALESGYGQALGASQSDLTRQLQAGSQLGTLSGNQASTLANIGQSLGTFGQSDLQRQMDAAKGQGALAQTAAEQGIRNASALEAVGASQQQQAQRGLDTAYNEFVAQRDYPQQQASFMNNIIRGLQVPQSTATSATGPASTYQASPLAQIASAGTGLAALGKLG